MNTINTINRMIGWGEKKRVNILNGVEILFYTSTCLVFISIQSRKTFSYPVSGSARIMHYS